MNDSLFSKQPYLDRFSLKEPPYSTRPNERFLYLTPTHKEAIAMIGKVILEREGAALVYGKFGTGKTTLMRRVYSELRDHKEHYAVGIIENGGYCPTPFQLAGAVLESFGEQSRFSDRKGRFDQLKQLLFDHYKMGLVSILLIDEAQELPAKVLEGLRGLLNFETADEKILQIILFGLPQITRRLAYAKSFRDRLVRTELEMMNRDQLANMLKWRFAQAGGNDFPFSDDALNHLYILTKGHPRTACGIAQYALELAAYQDGQVTKSIINKVKDKRFLD